MTRAARHATKREAIAPAAVPLHPDTVDMADLSRRAISMYASRDCGAAVKALADGCARQTRSGRVSLSRQFIERLFARDPAGLAEAAEYIHNTLGVARR